jgi:hypothetical protein
MHGSTPIRGPVSGLLLDTIRVEAPPCLLALTPVVPAAPLQRQRPAPDPKRLRVTLLRVGKDGYFPW